VHRRFGVEASVRASLHLYNDRDDIDALCDGLSTVRRLFARVGRVKEEVGGAG
jgi:cysteine desulfurase/selenocysteine lyase